MSKQGRRRGPAHIGTLKGYVDGSQTMRAKPEGVAEWLIRLAGLPRQG